MLKRIDPQKLEAAQEVGQEMNKIIDAVNEFKKLCANLSSRIDQIILPAAPPKTKPAQQSAATKKALKQINKNLQELQDIVTGLGEVSEGK